MVGDVGGKHVESTANEAHHAVGMPAGPPAGDRIQALGESGRRPLPAVTTLDDR
jgi:hypothetical protein